jgi:hypothetical protein
MPVSAQRLAGAMCRTAPPVGWARSRREHHAAGDPCAGQSQYHALIIAPASDVSELAAGTDTVGAPIPPQESVGGRTRTTRLRGRHDQPPSRTSARVTPRCLTTPE